MNDRTDKQVRTAAAFLFQFTFIKWSYYRVLQCLAVMHSAMRRDAAESGEEELFDATWKQLIIKETNSINLSNPIEPKVFDEKFDFRMHIK